MNSTTARQLIALNNQFYQTFSVQFSATRQRIQPGVRRLIGKLTAAQTILDLGCGNGELGRELYRQGWNGCYVGVDFSPGLLEDATGLQAVLIQADLAEETWADLPEIAAHPPGLALAFAVLHHIPGQALRERLLGQVYRLLPPGGHLIHSNWQFLNSPRLARRVQPWSAIGLTATDVDEGDFLLDWRAGGAGLRYVHHYHESELLSLAQRTHFEVVETFYSDGEGGRLGLYQVWQKA